MLGISAVQVALTLILLVAIIEWWRLRHTGPKLVVREFRVGTPETVGEFVYILGRQSGIVAWMLTMFGLHAQTSFSVTDNEVARETVGPSGFETVYAPLREIAVSRCSYYRPFWVLALSLGFYLYGLITLVLAMKGSDDYVRQTELRSASTTLWACAISGTLLYVWYALSKRVLLSVISRGSQTLGISFKRSVIENIQVELGRAVQAVDLINARLLAKAP